MPDPALTEALREAYASAPTDAVILHTLEIWHPAFSVPIRVVNDAAPLDARLEATAPRDAGAVVTFAAFAFEVTPPEQTPSGVPVLGLALDNVSSEITAQLELAAASRERVRVIYRAFLADAALDGPETDPPMELTLTSASANLFRVTGQAGFPDLLNRRFPKLEYDLDSYPGLAP